VILKWKNNSLSHLPTKSTRREGRNNAYKRTGRKRRNNLHKIGKRSNKLREEKSK
jgi:hypothetical protein